MARRTFMRAFSAQAGTSFDGWRQQARLFAALEMLAQRCHLSRMTDRDCRLRSGRKLLAMFSDVKGPRPFNASANRRCAHRSKVTAKFVYRAQAP
jgi:AraC-like DNA-binding protein